MAEKDNDLVVRKRVLHGVSLWWIGRGRGKNFTPYSDIFAPTGYGFSSKARAEQRVKEIEERLANRDRETLDMSSSRKDNK
jgi:hypothetical protein